MKELRADENIINCKPDVWTLGGCFSEDYRRGEANQLVEVVNHNARLLDDLIKRIIKLESELKKE